MKTITTTIKWRNAAEELPEMSCEVLVWRSSSNSVMLVQYSASHGRFNCCDFCSKELAARVAIAVDYWCYAYEIQMALTTFPEEETLPGKFELARGEKKIQFREEAWNAFEKELKECLAELASKGESVRKPKMAPEEVMRAFRDSARLTKTDANEEAGEIAYFMSDTLRAAVIDALLRQIPMKPDLLSDDGDEGEENLYGCPRCSNPYIDSPCCSVCGQALDWNKDENKKTVFCMDCRYWRKCDFRCDLYGIIVPGPWSCPDGRKGEKE